MQTQKLYAKALEYADLHGQETVGSLLRNRNHFLFLAQKAKFVRGVEIVPAAIENAKENAKLNHLENTEVLCREKQKKCCRESIRKMALCRCDRRRSAKKRLR